MKQTRRPKLTLKAAKTLAIAEVGTAAGLTPHENNNTDYQRYEMQMGKHTVVISNACDYWGIAYVSFGGNWTYYKIASLEESADITEHERKKERNEAIRDAAACQSAFTFKALLEEHGLETCRALLDEAIAFCGEHGIPLYAINENPANQYGEEYGTGADGRKLFADLYIDDRAINTADIETLMLNAKEVL